MTDEKYLSGKSRRRQRIKASMQAMYERFMDDFVRIEGVHPLAATAEPNLRKFRDQTMERWARRGLR